MSRTFRRQHSPAGFPVSPGGRDWSVAARRCPPVPTLDVAECWLPTEEQVCGAPITKHATVCQSERAASEDPTQVPPSDDKTDQAATSDDKTDQTAAGETAGEERVATAGEANAKVPSAQAKTTSRAENEESLLAGLHELLQAHRQELGSFIDLRLAAHHASLSKTMEELASKKSELPTTPRSCPQTLPVPVPLSSPRLSKTQSRMESKMSTATADLRKCDFEQHERLKINRSRQARPSMMTAASTGSARPMHCRWISQEAMRIFMESPFAESFVCVFIIANVCFLGVEVQATRGIPDTQIPVAFKSIEFSFTTFFTVELLLRLYSYGPTKFACGPHRTWHILDTFLVSISLMEILIDVVTEINPKLDYIRVIRMIRASRILRVVRVMKFFRPLRILVYSVMNTIRSLFWTLILMGIIIYLFAVLFTLASSNALGSAAAMSFREPDESLEENFGSLWNSISSLFKAITGGMDWQHCVTSLKPLHPIWTALFTAYIAISHFAILNVVTGVVCQTAIESARQDQDIVVQAQLQVKQRYVKQFQDLFNQFDSDRSGQVTLQEFEERLADNTLQNYFAAMDLTVDEAWNLFKLLDNHETCAIDIEEFVSGCLKLRGTARSIDMHMLIYQSKWTMKKLAHLMGSVDDMYEMMYGSRRSPAPSEVNRNRSDAFKSEPSRMTTLSSKKSTASRIHLQDK